MKIQSFINVVEKFWVRAEMFFPSAEFEGEVVRLQEEVVKALRVQLKLPDKVNYFEIFGATRNAEMGEEAVQAFRVLCSYLDEKDSAVSYTMIGQLS